jgi:hypothetical protein
MAQTKQMTMNVEGEKVVLKARRTSRRGSGCIVYSVGVWSSFDGDWKSRVGVRFGELDGESSVDCADQALCLAIEKGMAKWLKETK